MATYRLQTGARLGTAGSVTLVSVVLPSVVLVSVSLPWSWPWWASCQTIRPSVGLDLRSEVTEPEPSLIENAKVVVSHQSWANSSS